MYMYVKAIDILPKIIASQRIKEALDWNQNNTGDLASVIKIKVNSRVMLPVNVDLNDRLVNGQLGTVKHVFKNLNGEVTKVYIKFDDAGAGQKKINKETFANQHSWVVEKFEGKLLCCHQKNTVSYNVGLGMYCPQSARVKPPKDSC